jgi:hypothetical protein
MLDFAFTRGLALQSSNVCFALFFKNLSSLASTSDRPLTADDCDESLPLVVGDATRSRPLDEYELVSVESDSTAETLRAQ